MDPTEAVLANLMADVVSALGRAQAAAPTAPVQTLLIAAGDAIATAAQAVGANPRLVLGIVLATRSHTAEEAHLAVAEGFAVRHEAEQRTGRSHGPNMGTKIGEPIIAASEGSAH